MRREGKGERRKGMGREEVGGRGGNGERGRSRQEQEEGTMLVTAVIKHNKFQSLVAMR